MTTASTPLRARSACHRISASPTRSQASSASRSSHEPGKRTTPNFTWAPKRHLRGSSGPAVIPNGAFGAADLDLVVLDQRVRQQPLAHLAEPRRVLDVELDEPADVHVGDALEAERRQRALDGLTLRVQDPRLGTDQDPGGQRSTQA